MIRISSRKEKSSRKEERKRTFNRDEISSKMYINESYLVTFGQVDE